MKRIEELVRSAVGYDQSRGDQVSVVNVRFAGAADAAGGTAAGAPLFDFDKNDVIRGVELLILGLVAVLLPGRRRLDQADRLLRTIGVANRR